MTTTLHEVRFGVELEGGAIPRARAACAVWQVVGGRIVHETQVIAADGRVWKVVRDASLTTWSPDLRCEVVSPILAYVDIPMLQDVVRALRYAGMQVSPCCGIHIHVDAALFDGKQLANLAKLTYQQEPLIYAALGISAARAARHAKPTDPAFIKRLERRRPQSQDALNRLWYGRHETRPTHYHKSRYRGVNFHAIWDKGTVEFRWFEASVHAGKVKAYVQFVLAVAVKALNARSATSRRRSFDPASAKFDWRCFLLRLGLIGSDFKTARKHLMALLPGDAAFKYASQRPKHSPKTTNDATCGTGTATPGPRDNEGEDDE
ncbi:MAG TPA: amidoligase family protein [Armatimonadota bacterium]|jgi:hypothetical protein